MAVDDIRQDEGCELCAYPDPLTGGEPWTIGWGSTGPHITQDTVWTQDQADSDLAERVAKIERHLTEVLPWFADLSEPRRAVLVNMTYQIGFVGLLGFHRMLNWCAVGAFAAAASAGLDSRWARQTPKRAERRMRQLATGVRS